MDAAEDDLLCADIDGVTAWVELLASRSIGEREVELLRADWSRRFRDDAAATRTALSELGTARDTLGSRMGTAATTERAEAVYSALHDGTALGEPDSRSVDVLRRAVNPWATDEANRLVLSEMDVEGWLKYASLCREVQGADPLRLSVSDRVVLYHAVVDHFEGHTRDEQLAVLSMGPIWPSLKAIWPQVSYDQQQRWVEVAPLPPPMRATSLGYAEVLLDSDLSLHAEALHGGMGQLPLGVERE